MTSTRRPAHEGAASATLSIPRVSEPTLSDSSSLRRGGLDPLLRRQRLRPADCTPRTSKLLRPFVRACFSWSQAVVSARSRASRRSLRLVQFDRRDRTITLTIGGIRAATSRAVSTTRRAPFSRVSIATSAPSGSVCNRFAAAIHSVPSWRPKPSPPCWCNRPNTTPGSITPEPVVAWSRPWSDVTIAPRSRHRARPQALA